MNNQNITPIEDSGLTLYPILVQPLLEARLEKGNMKRQVETCDKYGLDILELIASIESKNDYAVDSYTSDATLYSRRNARGRLQNADGTTVGYREVRSKSIKLIANDEICMPGGKNRGADKLGFNIKDTAHIIDASVKEYTRRSLVLGRCPITDLPPTQAELFLDDGSSSTELPQNPEAQCASDSLCSDREVIVTESTILGLISDLSLDEIPPSLMPVLSESAHSTILKKLYYNAKASDKV